MHKTCLTATALLLALLASLVHNGRGALPSVLFHLSLTDEKRTQDEITVSITQYNKNSAGFYNTGGSSLEGLAVIPASKLQKRKLFQDINMLKRDGLVMVFDLDRQKIGSIRLLNRNTAVAATEEVWAVALQDIRTRKPLSNVKAASVKVRYLLHHEPSPAGNLTWIIQEADVYPANEPVPELNLQRVL